MPRSGKTENVEDDELIARVRAGETRLFAQLVARYQDPVYAMCLRFLGDSAEAEDVAQEAFLRVHRGLASSRGKRGFPRGCTGSRGTSAPTGCGGTGSPRARPHPSMTASDVSDGRVDLEKGVLDAEEQGMVRQALDGLDEIYRSVIILLYYQKLSYEQIAAVLEVPVKTVETRLYRARRLLRKRLESARAGRWRMRCAQVEPLIERFVDGCVTRMRRAASRATRSPARAAPRESARRAGSPRRSTPHRPCGPRAASPSGSWTRCTARPLPGSRRRKRRARGRARTARMYRRLGLSFMLTAAVLAASLLIPRAAYPTLIGARTADAGVGRTRLPCRAPCTGADRAVRGILGEQQIGGNEQ